MDTPEKKPEATQVAARSQHCLLSGPPPPDQRPKGSCCASSVTHKYASGEETAPAALSVIFILTIHTTLYVAIVSGSKLEADTSINLKSVP